MTTRCRECGGLVTRPGLFGCNRNHPAPTTAQKIAWAIEHDIRDRRGLKGEWEGIDDDTQDDIRDTWVGLIEYLLPEDVQ